MAARAGCDTLAHGCTGKGNDQVRLEATVAGCFVVGEDLGTVEPEVHEAMSRGGLLGTKVWWFDQAIERWPEDCLATVTTHDLPTVAGVVGGTDGDDAMREAVHATCPGLDIVEVEVRQEMEGGDA